MRPGQLTPVPTPDGSPAEGTSDGRYGDMIETTIDTESIHGIAPDANIVAIGDSTAQGANLVDSMIYAMDHTHASIVSASLSFDPPPAMRQTYDQVYQEGAVQGVGFYISAGDGGFRMTPDGAGDFLNPSASSGWETTVGGTSLAIGPNGKREWETGHADRGLSVVIPRSLRRRDMGDTGFTAHHGPVQDGYLQGTGSHECALLLASSLARTMDRSTGYQPEPSVVNQ